MHAKIDETSVAEARLIYLFIYPYLFIYLFADVKYLYLPAIK